ncbi:MAG TPA: thioredoxin domain-containing protein [Gemmatimonadaceae bacterium]|nr:thioredoxin domain-containing protein [Gemmatimonadaceae bacterium]
MVKRQRAGKNRALYLSLGAIALVGAFLIYRSAEKPARATTITDVPATNLRAEGYLKGNPNAPVQILEFADFECPACAQFATITEPDVRTRLIETGIANLRFFDYPLAQHRNSLAAHNAAACAAEQEKFWEMHDKLFAGQGDWSMGATSNPKRIFSRYANEIGLDGNRWEECYDSRRHEARIRANAQEGNRRQIQSTPTFVVGRRMAPGAISYDELKRLVDSARVEASRGAPTASAPTAGAPADSAKRP